MILFSMQIYLVNTFQYMVLCQIATMSMTRALCNDGEESGEDTIITVQEYSVNRVVAQSWTCPVCIFVGCTCKMRPSIHVTDSGEITCKKCVAVSA